MDIGSIFSKSRMTTIVLMIVFLYVIAHYSTDMCDALGLTYKGTV